MGIAGAAFAVVLALLPGAQPAPTMERRLEAGRPLDGQLEPGEAHSYVIELQEGQFLRLAVVQDGADVVVALTEPSDAVFEVDVPDGRFGAEPASLLASKSGTYHLAIRAKTVRGSLPGRYVVETDAPRAATLADRTRAAAERSLAEASALIRTGKPESAKEAVEILGQVLGRWRALPDSRWEAEALVQRALAHTVARDHASALQDAVSAAGLWRQVGDPRGEAFALTTAGVAHQALFQYEQAIGMYEKAMLLRQAAGQRQEQAELLWRLRTLYRDAGEPARQVEVAREALALLRPPPSRAHGDRQWEMSALSVMGSARVNAGDLEGGLADFRASVAVGREIGDSFGAATQLQNIGAVYEELGDSAGALAALREALPAVEAGEPGSGSATTLMAPRVHLAGVYHNMGRAHSSLGQSKEALEFFERSIAVRRELRDRRGEAWTLTAMGRESNAVRDFEKAAGDLESAVKLAIETGDPWLEGTARGHLGRSRLELGQAAQARDHLRRAAELGRSLGDAVREVEALQLLGRLANEAGDRAAARTMTEAALGVLEARRHRITSPRLRSALAGSLRDVYELYVDVLVGLHGQQPAKGFDARALEASELARARGLVDVLSEAGLDVREGADAALLAKERTLRDRLGAAVDRQQRLSKAPPEATEAMARQVQLLSAEWDELQAALRASSPRLMELRDPPPPSAAAIQKDVLDADTVLLEYALGEKRSFLWVVSRDGITTHELPARAVVNEAAREAYAELAEPGPRLSARGGAQRALARLSRMILEPAADALTARRVLVVADGALHYVPFSALPHPRQGDPLVATHEIVSAPSASVLPLLRRDVAGKRSPARTVVVVADPVFGREDERVRGRHASAAPSGPPAPGDHLGRALRSAGLEGALPRLPFTRREAQAILSLVPPGERRAALDFDASRATVTGAAMADFRIVHLATHGFLNSAAPELSGIVLSLVDPQGRDEQGFLTAAEVFNLRLNAELVVLSGCRTALGKELRGEGLVGLGRGFMYAGTPRVLASLWKVDDAATAELMKSVYRGVLKQGLPPARALRRAQLDLMRRQRYRHPFYWAAFQLQGEWR
jgi:CHAT domain-containing protein/tetratricopeptide (TPR) repeat protein